MIINTQFSWLSCTPLGKYFSRCTGCTELFRCRKHVYSLRSGASEYGQEKNVIRKRRGADGLEILRDSILLLIFFFHIPIVKKKKKKEYAEGELLTHDSENVLINSSGSEAKR